MIKPFCPTRLFKTTSIIVSLTPDPTMLWAISSYHMHSHTHTRARLVVCFSSVTYLHHCCVTTVPPLLCCLIVSIHPRQSNLKKNPTRYPLPLLRPPPNLHPPVYLLSRCLFVPLSVVSLFPCVTGLSFFVVVAVAVKLVVLVNFCRSAKLEFCTLPRTQKTKKKKKIKKGNRGRKTTQIFTDWAITDW